MPRKIPLTKEEASEYARVWRNANRQKYREYQRKWAKENSDRRLRKERERYDAKRIRLIASGKIAAYYQRANLLRASRRLAALDELGWSCAICRVQVVVTEQSAATACIIRRVEAKPAIVLCRRCNNALVRFRSNVQSLNRAIEYLSLPPAASARNAATNPAADRVKVSAATLKLRGISRHQYKSLLEYQKYVCAICMQDSQLVIDHNHSSGAVRGLLLPQMQSRAWRPPRQY